MAKAKSTLKAQILERTEREKVKFIRLQFTDILGAIKNVEMPDRQFEEALDGESCSTARRSRVSSGSRNPTCSCKPDLVDVPDLSVDGPTGERVGRIICDIYNPDGTPFAGCPAFDAEARHRHGGARRASR